MEIAFFKSPADFRKWFEQHYNTTQELWVGYYKKGSGQQRISWPESVDQALCFGWIDGIRKTIDEISYKIRFTPRKTSSTWSSVNIKRAQELIDAGLMQPAGRKAFQARKENRSGIYAYEQRNQQFDEQYEQKFKANKAAWEFFQAQPPGYQKTAIWWVISAKRAETRLKRLAQLIADSAENRRIAPLRFEKSKSEKSK